MAQYHVEKAAKIDTSIWTVRGVRVMIDLDLARIYGVQLKRLNEQLRRNAERFPEDFAFQLTPPEWAHLLSQFAISKNAHGGRRTRPWVFTEHGALMLASALSSPIAVQASIRVVRAFVLMREQLAAHKELTGKLAELESRVSGHDEAITDLFEAIRQLVHPPEKPRREIGFHVRETAPPYRVKTRRRF